MRAVVVVPYDPVWSELFESEAAALTEIFGETVLRWHHIGSTSVPGLAAKPVIDILGELHAPEEADTFDAAMRAAGYEPKGENGIPGRRFYSRTRNGERSHHVHLFRADSADVTRHLQFRDYLRAHPEKAETYGRLKLELAKRFPFDIEAYIAGKSPLVRELEAEALVAGQK